MVVKQKKKKKIKKKEKKIELGFEVGKCIRMFPSLKP